MKLPLEYLLVKVRERNKRNITIKMEKVIVGCMYKNKFFSSMFVKCVLCVSNGVVVVEEKNTCRK